MRECVCGCERACTHTHVCPRVLTWTLSTDGKFSVLSRLCSLPSCRVGLSQDRRTEEQGRGAQRWPRARPRGSRGLSRLLSKPLKRNHSVQRVLRLHVCLSGRESEKHRLPESSVRAGDPGSDGSFLPSEPWRETHVTHSHLPCEGPAQKETVLQHRHHCREWSPPEVPTAGQGRGQVPPAYFP